MCKWKAFFFLYTNLKNFKKNIQLIKHQRKWFVLQVQEAGHPWSTLPYPTCAPW